MKMPAKREIYSVIVRNISFGKEIFNFLKKNLQCKIMLSYVHYQ